MSENTERIGAQLGEAIGAMLDAAGKEMKVYRFSNRGYWIPAHGVVIAGSEAEAIEQASEAVLATPLLYPGPYDVRPIGLPALIFDGDY